MGAWYRRGGPEGLKVLLDLGETPKPGDLPPGLEWESVIWDLYLKIRTEWPLNSDMSTIHLAIQAKGWDLETALSLFGAIDRAITPEPAHGQ